MRIVLDTNVAVSGLLTDHGPPAQVVDLCISGDIALAVDGRILAEYEEVLQRPMFRFEANDVAAFLAMARDAERVIGVPLPVLLPDADDIPFLEVAVSAGVDALVTGNIKHFRTSGGTIDIPILTPRQLLERYAR